MSAILGFFRRDGKPAEPAVLERMVEQMAHRGPDGAGLWCEGTVALGHLRLRTSDTEEHQSMPLVSRCGNHVLTADARLDNREELLDRLKLTGSKRHDLSDGALILAAYERWGEACVDHLLGDFAFVLWDRRRQTLFCARDHFGVRPLYYYQSETVFAFATEIKALFCLPDVPRRLDEGRVASLLSVRDPVEPLTTLYEGIHRFPPRHLGYVSKDAIHLTEYWALDSSKEIRLGSDSEYAEAFRHHFSEAVRCRIEGEGPVGSMLSGGIDSSSVACMARHLLRQSGEGPLLTFSAVFDEVEKSDERQYVQAVVEGGNIEPHFLSADGVSPLADVERLLWHHDQANPAGNLYINWQLAHMARQRGVRVLLDGYDGDTTISHGHGYLVELARARRWGRLAAEMRQWRRNVGVGEPWFPAWIRWLQHYEIDPMVERAAPLRWGRRAGRSLQWRLRRSAASSGGTSVKTLIRPELAARTGVLESRGERGESPTTERAFHYRKVTWAFHSEILETLDKVAGACGVSIRFPFWDRRLVEFCLALPSDQKRRDGWARWIIRPAMEGILPPAIQWRGSKSNLSYGLSHGLLKWERARLDRLVQQPPELLGEYVDLAGMRRSYDRFVARSADADEDLALWRALALALWLEREPVSALVDRTRAPSVSPPRSAILVGDG